MMSKATQSKIFHPSYPIIVISLCAAFLFYKYVLQIYPSIITDQLMREFQLTGAGLGNLAATFYYAYTITQLFVGVILDKYSARWITSTAIFTCALGVFLFSYANTELTAGLSRGLMGVGVAFATVAYMKLAAGWFPPQRYAFVSGLLATAAMAGAVFGQAPLAWFVSLAGWRESLYVVGLVGFALALIFAIVVRDASPALEHASVGKKTPISLKDILAVLQSKQNWLLTLYCGLAFTPVAVFGGLWGTPFLQEAYGLSKTDSAWMVSLVFIGLGIGSPLLGMLSDHLSNRRRLMMYCTLLSCAAVMSVLYFHPMPTWLLGSLLFIFGFALGAFMLVFTLGKELNSPFLTATVIAMLNTSDAVFTAITEPGIGKLLDLTWNGKIVNGVPYFSLHGYHIALAVLPLYLLIAALLILWIKDTPESNK